MQIDNLLQSFNNIEQKLTNDSLTFIIKKLVEEKSIKSITEISGDGFAAEAMVAESHSSDGETIGVEYTIPTSNGRLVVMFASYAFLTEKALSQLAEDCEFGYDFPNAILRALLVHLILQNGYLLPELPDDDENVLKNIFILIGADPEVAAALAGNILNGGTNV